MDDYKLPALYGKTRLVLLPVDPHLIHVYWEVAPDDLDKAKEEGKQAQEILRFYKAGKMAKEDELADCFDVEIDLQARTWYVHLWSAEESYFVDLALKRKDGTLIRLVRSQVVQMPRTRPAIPVDQHWMKVESAERRAEIVPPPSLEHKRSQEVATPPVHEASASPVTEVIGRESISKPVDSAEVVREMLWSVYSRHGVLHEDESQALIDRPYGREPQAVRPIVQNRPEIDLSAMAERDFAAGLFSAQFRRAPLDSKK